VEGLRLFVPENMGLHLREPILALSCSTGAEIFEFSHRDGQVRTLDPADVGNLQSRLLPRPEMDSFSCRYFAEISLARNPRQPNRPQ